jgi:N-acetylmuramoyl-L-alanine amidase
VDIPYHYVIAPDGSIHATRDTALAGDTNTEYDPRGHALLMLMGNFDLQQPTAAQLESAVALMAHLARSNGLDETAIASHKDYSTQTACPGAALYARLDELRAAVRARLGP